MNNIVFVGDSFCATYDFNLWSLKGQPAHQHGTSYPTHPSLVADHFNCNLHPHGYGGQSWWYIRQKYRAYYHEGHGAHDTLAVVFFHTNPDRINNACNEQLGNHHSDNLAIAYYYNDIHDKEYANWACQQWFKEIAQEHAQIKTIHFHCFPYTVQWSNLLPGMVYTTPVIHLSLGELTGTDDEIFKKSSFNETRYNHLNNYNNRALADVIIHSINNYQPGQYTIDTTKFEQANPNAYRYPAAGFGTE